MKPTTRDAVFSHLQRARLPLRWATLAEHYRADLSGTLLQHTRIVQSQHDEHTTWPAGFAPPTRRR